MSRIREFFIKNHKLISFWLVALLLPGVYFLVYYTGGTRYVYAHLMYLPIVLAGAFLGMPIGVVAGIIAGVLLGPHMPLDVESGEMQSTFNWMFRMFSFIVIGLVSGIFSDIYRRKLVQVKKILWVNQDTNIPNILSLKALPDSDKSYFVATIIVANRNYFLNIFGIENVNRIMYKTYRNLMNMMPDGSYVFQADSDKLWCLINTDKTEEMKDLILEALDTDVIIKTANVYVEYYVGFGHIKSLEEIKSLEPFKRTDSCAMVALSNNIKSISCDDANIPQEIDSDLLSEFYNALKNNETFLAYHPVYDTKTLEIYKLEALIRWMHPKKGLIPPNDFIPLIERTQLIQPLMEWVLDKIIDKVAEFQESNINAKIFMNISAKNFYNKELVFNITRKLNEKNINPESIGIEITESVLLDNVEESQEMIKQLRRLGISISIDDFGRGYSSLGYLSKFDIDYLKIDRIFIKAIDDPTNLEVMKAALSLAGQLNFKTVAEGVEDIETLKKVTDLKFDYAQGFYFCKPVHQDKIIDHYIENFKYMRKTK